MTSRSKGRSRSSSRRSRGRSTPGAKAPGRNPSGRRSSSSPGRAITARAEQAAEARRIGELYGHTYRVVRNIPRGRVATYGQVAELAGVPGAARVVGAAMKASLPEMGLPWQRVVGKSSASRARVRIHDPIGAATQRALLEDEGVEVSDGGGISLRTYGWIQTGGTGSAGARRSRIGRARAGRRRRSGS